MTAACSLAYLHFATSDQLPAPSILTAAVTTASAFAKISSTTSANAAILIHRGISIAMPILERIMQPLIKASEARAREAAAAEFAKWKRDQISKGVVFIETEPDDQEPSKPAG